MKPLPFWNSKLLCQESWEQSPWPTRDDTDPGTKKGGVISSATLPGRVLRCSAERQERHPQEGLGWRGKAGQEILTLGYRAHGPDMAKQVCSAVYFPLIVSCLEQGTSWFWLGFLPSPTRWHNPLGLQLLWMYLLTFLPNQRGCDLISPHRTGEGGVYRSRKSSLALSQLQGWAWPCWVDREIIRENRPVCPGSWLHIPWINRGPPPAVFGHPIHRDRPGSQSLRVLSQCQGTAQEMSLASTGWCNISQKQNE